jgi:hypothetical protein
MTFERPSDRILDEQNEQQESQCPGDDRREVEQLEVEVHLIADAVRQAKEFEDDHELPGEPQAISARSESRREQLWEDQMADSL